MNLVLSSILAPIVGGVPVALAAYVLSGVAHEAEILFLIVVVGLPFAIVICLIGTTILQHRDLFEVRYSHLYCGFIGALIASFAAMPFFELGAIFLGVTLWDLLSGISFRRLLNYRAD